jgi:hypothetical protein
MGRAGEILSDEDARLAALRLGLRRLRVWIQKNFGSRLPEGVIAGTALGCIY